MQRQLLPPAAFESLFGFFKLVLWESISDMNPCSVRTCHPQFQSACEREISRRHKEDKSTHSEVMLQGGGWRERGGRSRRKRRERRGGGVGVSWRHSEQQQQQQPGHRETNTSSKTKPCLSSSWRRKSRKRRRWSKRRRRSWSERRGRRRQNMHAFTSSGADCCQENSPQELEVSELHTHHILEKPAH